MQCAHHGPRAGRFQNVRIDLIAERGGIAVEQIEFRGQREPQAAFDARLERRLNAGFLPGCENGTVGGGIRARGLKKRLNEIGAPRRNRRPGLCLNADIELGRTGFFKSRLKFTAREPLNSNLIFARKSVCRFDADRSAGLGNECAARKKCPIRSPKG